jgi:hypothetical protein
MSKFIDVGKKSELSQQVAAPTNKSEKYYPSFYLDVVPDELWAKDVGAECAIECKAVIKRKSQNENDDKKTKSLELEIRQIAAEESETEKEGADMKRQYRGMKGIEEND